MIFTINGFNIVPYIEEGGVVWQNNGVDGPETGRTMDATMHRDFVGWKTRCDVSCVWMPKEIAYRLYQAIMPVWVTIVTDTIPWINGTVTKTMYSNNWKPKLLTEYTDGTKLYDDISFPLVER